MSKLAYRPDIDGLRAVAVLSVVIYHVTPSALPGGFLGVDIFFVISGYLISLILFREQDNGSFSFIDFYSRRVRRLFPALAVVLAVTLSFGAFALFADEYKLLGSHAFSAIVFALNFRLMDEAGYFDVVSASKPLLHLWSLSVEEQFYLLWPIFIIFTHRLRIRASAVLFICAALSLVFAVHYTGTNPDKLYYHPLARFWEMLIGAALAYWQYKKGSNILPVMLQRSGVLHLISAGGMGLVLWGLFTFCNIGTHPGPATVVPLLGVATIIACGEGVLANRLLSVKPLVYIGLISYPVYLWHWPVLSYIRIMESGMPATWLLWAGAALSMILACGTYHFIERPLRSLIPRLRTVFALSSAMLAVLLVSRAVVGADGMPGRPSVRYMVEAEAQMKREPRQDETCVARFSAINAPVYCRENLAGPQMIAIIGDSHAHTLFPGVAELAGRRGYGTLLLANSGCPPLEGTATGKTTAMKDACVQSIELMLSTVENDPRLMFVVIATRGPFYISGRGYGPAEETASIAPFVAYQAEGGQTADKIFQFGLQSTITRLKQSGKGVAYFLQVPELGVPARNCLGRPLSLTPSRGCSGAHSDYVERMSAYRAIVGNVQTAQPSLKVIDPGSLFCDSKQCVGMLDGHLLYADDDHLSVQGSRRVASIIFEALPIKGVIK